MSFQDVYGALVNYGIAGIPKLLHKLAGILGLSQGELLFLDLLHTFRFDDSLRVSAPSLKAMSDLTGISKRSLINWSNSLQRKGFLIVKQRFVLLGKEKRRQTSNLYDLSPVYRILFEFLFLVDNDVVPDPRQKVGREFLRFVVKNENEREALRKLLLTRAKILKETQDGYLEFVRSAWLRYKAIVEEEERLM